MHKLNIICVMIFILVNQVVYAQSTVGPQQPQISIQTKSFHEWRQAKILDSEAKIKALKENLLKSRTAASAKTLTEAGTTYDLNKLTILIQKEEQQLSLTQDLTISDYFVGYLTKQKSLQTAIKEVSGRLTADEVAELMTAYANNFFSSKPQAVPPAPRADSEY